MDDNDDAKNNKNSYSRPSGGSCSNKNNKEQHGDKNTWNTTNTDQNDTNNDVGAKKTNNRSNTKEDSSSSSSSSICNDAVVTNALMLVGCISFLLLFAYMLNDMGEVDTKYKSIGGTIKKVKKLITQRAKLHYENRGGPRSPNCTLFLGRSTIPGGTVGFGIFAGKDHVQGDTIIMDSGLFIPISPTGDDDREDQSSIVMPQLGFLLNYHPDLHNIMVDDNDDDDDNSDLSSSIWRMITKYSYKSNDNRLLRKQQIRASRSVQAGEELFFPISHLLTDGSSRSSTSSTTATTETQPSLSTTTMIDDLSLIFDNTPLPVDYKIAEGIIDDAIETLTKQKVKENQKVNKCPQEIEPALKLLKKTVSRLNPKVAALLPSNEKRLREIAMVTGKVETDHPTALVQPKKTFSAAVMKSSSFMGLQMHSQCLSYVKTVHTTSSSTSSTSRKSSYNDIRNQNHLLLEEDEDDEEEGMSVHNDRNNVLSSSSFSSSSSSVVVVATKDLQKGSVVIPVPLYVRKRTNKTKHLEAFHRSNHPNNSHTEVKNHPMYSSSCSVVDNDTSNLAETSECSLLEEEETQSLWVSCFSHPNLEMEFCPLTIASEITTVTTRTRTTTAPPTTEAIQGMMHSVDDNSTGIEDDNDNNNDATVASSHHPSAVLSSQQTFVPIANVEYQWSSLNPYNKICHEEYSATDEIVKSCSKVLSLDVIAINDIQEGEQLFIQKFSGTDAFYELIPDPWKKQ